MKKEKELAYRFTECDFCNESVPAPYEVATPRPSDPPTEMCCVMSACVVCGKGMATGPDPEGGCATFEEWCEAVEEEKLEGIYFYS